MGSGLTRGKADALLAFESVFTQADETFGHWQDRSYHREDGTLVQNYWIEYSQPVEEFCRLLEQDGWLDPGYNPTEVNPFVVDACRIEKANLKMIRWMLTYFVRVERFSEGARLSLIQTGFLSAVLSRLKAVRSRLPEG